MADGHVVDELYAFLLIDEDGDESVPAVGTEVGMLPLVGADWARIDAMRPIAQRIADENGKEITLARFHLRENLEVIKPGEGSE